MDISVVIISKDEIGLGDTLASLARKYHDGG